MSDVREGGRTQVDERSRTNYGPRHWIQHRCIEMEPQSSEKPEMVVMEMVKIVGGVKVDEMVAMVEMVKM